MSGTSFGASPKRKEDPDLLTGRGRFVDDIVLNGMYAAAFMRSPLAHARIKSIDAKAALAIPGIHAVFTHHDLPATLRERRLPLFVPHPRIAAHAAARGLTKVMTTDATDAGLLAGLLRHFSKT